MNSEDKVRFARYMPGYVEVDSDDEDKTKQLGFIDNITVNPNELINKVLEKSEKNKTYNK